MNRLLVSMAVVGLILLSATGFAADRDEPTKEKSIFLKEVPAVLTARIDKAVAEITKKHPVSDKTMAEIETMIGNGTFRGKEGSKDDKEQKRAERRIRELGLRAVPTIAKGMLSKDEAIRENAYSMAGTMMGFIGLVQPRSEKAKEIGDVVVLLAERGLLDSSSDVRYEAAGVLYLAGMALWPDIPEEVKTGLARAEKEDPTLKNRQWAHYSRYLLGLTELSPDMVPSKELLK